MEKSDIQKENRKRVIESGKMMVICGVIVIVSGSILLRNVCLSDLLTEVKVVVGAILTTSIIYGAWAIRRGYKFIKDMRDLY